LRTLGSLRVFLEEGFQIADERGTVVACGFDGLLQFVGWGKLIGGGL